MSTKDKLNIPRHPLPTENPDIRRKVFNEVALGFDEHLAVEEAMRCIQCKRPYCMEGCPVAIDIPKFIQQITERDYLSAARTIRATNSLPSICGRVCPQEMQCEKTCILAKKGLPVAIGALERFVSDFEREYGSAQILARQKSTDKRIAIIGSGPAGLTAAGYLVAQGHEITVFEALHEAGGVLIYGIPEFRLPKFLVRNEVHTLEKMGVQFSLNTLVGRTITIDELFGEGYKAVFLGPGAGTPIFMNLPGENLCGVLSANEFLTRVNLMKAFQFPKYDTPVYCGKRVAVIGGGNTAMDAARTAIRFNPEAVYIIYRRSEKELPAKIDEVHHAQEEGVQFMYLTSPVAYNGDSKGWVQEMECIKMELIEPDESGRRRTRPIHGSNFKLSVDTVIVAIGAQSNDLLIRTTQGLETTNDGYLIVDPNTQMTSRAGVFAGGDIASYEATVISAMGQGRIAGKAIHEYVMQK